MAGSMPSDRETGLRGLAHGTAGLGKIDRRPGARVGAGQQGDPGGRPRVRRHSPGDHSERRLPRCGTGRVLRDRRVPRPGARPARRPGDRRRDGEPQGVPGPRPGGDPAVPRGVRPLSARGVPGAGPEGDLRARGGGDGEQRAGRVGAVRAAGDAGGGRRRREGRSRGRGQAHRVGAGEDGIPSARCGGSDGNGGTVITRRAPPRRWRTSRGRRGRSGQDRGPAAPRRGTTRPWRPRSAPPAPGGSRRSPC